MMNQSSTEFWEIQKQLIATAKRLAADDTSPIAPYIIIGGGGGNKISYYSGIILIGVIIIDFWQIGAFMFFAPG